MFSSDVVLSDDHDYDVFLFAKVGEDRTGATVSVLSTLARLDLEPWTEARELARLDQEEALARLMAHFDADTDIPSLANKASVEKLISLLPKRSPHHVSMERAMQYFGSSRISLYWLVVFLFGILVMMRVYYLSRGG